MEKRPWRSRPSRGVRDSNLTPFFFSQKEWPCIINAMPRKTKRKTLAQDFDDLMKQEGKHPEKLTYDNQPLGFFEAFPTVEQVNRQQSVLVERLWWWRQANEAGAPRIFADQNPANGPAKLLRLYLERQQLSAYFYELRARYEDRYSWEFARPWIRCSHEQRDRMRCVWPMKSTPVTWTPSEQGNKNWIKLPDERFNLEANNEALTRQFLEVVNQRRADLGVAAPGPGQGVLRKPVSFLPIEHMDRRHYLKARLNDAERSAVSKAKRQYEKACQAVNLVP